ncbi:MAG: cbb3-type cytochrome c oxidase subunit 3 [Gammaproteobacteria bacterium]|jgi:cytochrome c oxidase cbb3-type subunit 4|nr:cbb3-type cytochrome c oxidase subunit 3 [Gammaproteobacteria bacterium]MBT4081494.1 cbb3-type cytochrome c oxidase subunit 3 [Gammaproteobacteria bacterium]MBT4331513.1 cbb3-type cytochrome c oxidase subunit 3 [Gammaproteobacteria bacterium]MBT5360123.1 cbb3-type cytochrome c oxidase subunit 3 [Gammaproteobacteria bacterium]MBT5636118.1 cbb3-type cytochrome c oxidase subunit 3 [Gammaproteobacteria bacterium]
MSNGNETGYFYTDWAALTVNDWVGMIVTITVAVVLVVAYLLVFNPKNKEQLESQRYLVDGPEGEEFLVENSTDTSTHGEKK